MKLKNTLALSLAAVMAAGLTACGSGADTASAASPAADSTAAESTEAAADTTAAPDGDGDPTTVDSGTIELAPEGSEEMYLAVSSQFDDVGYEFTLLDHDTLRWGSEFEFYQKMA